MKRIIILLLGAVLLGSTLWLDTAADAAATPVVDAHAAGWSHMVRSPAGIEIGDGGAPFIKRLSWQQWRATHSNGTGKLHVQHNPSCQPSYLCRYDVYHVKVHLHRVITHRGTAVFSRMRWTYGRAAHVLYLRLTSRILDLLTQTLLPRLLTNVWICHRRSHQSRRCPTARVSACRIPPCGSSVSTDHGNLRPLR